MRNHIKGRREELWGVQETGLNMARQNHTNEQMGVNQQATLWQSTCAHHHASAPSVFNTLTVSNSILDKEGKGRGFCLLTLLAW